MDSAAGDDAVTYFVVLRLGDDAPRYELVRAPERPLRDDAVGIALGHAGQGEQEMCIRDRSKEGKTANCLRYKTHLSDSEIRAEPISCQEYLTDSENNGFAEITSTCRLVSAPSLLGRGK